jgi:putative DNA primase/helicase
MKPVPADMRAEAATTLADDDDDHIPPFSEEAIALEFAERHADDLRHVATWNKWFRWNGKKWQVDETHHAFDLARAVCREAAAEASKRQDKRLAKQIARAQTVASIVTLGRADRRIATVSKIWDADPWLLNTPDGIVNLRTGDMVAHSSMYFMTKMTAVSPGADCPLWESFLRRITGGDDDLAVFLQIMCGYALTGSTIEHALFFLFGLGGNGKGVFMNTISGILADYATSAPVETFTASSGEQHPTGLAGLRGARLVSAVETEEGRRWAEARIKQLTGGDPISARFMRQDFFEFMPQFKLIIAGNHKPGLRSVDEAIRRRFHLVPFTTTIPAEERDPNLKDKLRAEWPGILRWMIDGCRLWQERGLVPPKAVRDATAEYLLAEDALSAWIEDRCERDPNAWETTSRLYTSWKAWGDASGEFTGSMKRFAQSLDAHGFHAQHRRTARGFVGLKVTETAGFSDSDWDRR